MTTDREKTAVTADELKAMSDAEILAFARRYSYPDQYENPEALAFVEYWLPHINGKRYQETGDVSAFNTSIQ